MINTSIAYHRAIEKNREFRLLDRITFKDGRYIDLMISDFMSYKINEATSGSGKFDIGMAAIKEYTITLDNTDGRFDLYDFEGAVIRARIGLKLEDGRWEDLNKGTYRVVDAVFTDVTLQLTAYDAMLFFDKPYSSCKIKYPATILEIVRSACRDCQVSFDASTIEMGNYRVEKRPDDGSITYRDVIGYCAQIMGAFARIDHLGQLSFGWYNFNSIPSGGLNGGIFDNGAPYASGDRADGGTFDDYNTGADYDAGSFVDMDYAHNFYNMRSQSINTADITVTGIQIEIKAEGSKKETYLYGTDTYVLEVKDNPLIQSDTIKTVAKHIGDKIINKPFRPLAITIQSDPSIEAGDMAQVTDRKENSYVTCVTETTFTLGGAQQVSCSAETPSEKTYTRYGAGTKLLDKVKDETESLLSDYDIAVQNMNELAANTLGFYYSAVTQPDGSLVSYRHDKPKLSESKIVYKKGIDGFFVTQNYTGDDETTRWTSGFDSSGNAVLNILSAIGINFDWAHGGILTLGGGSNGNGTLKILDTSGNQIGYINNTGVHFNKGEFSGELKAANGTFKGKLEAATGTFKGKLTAEAGGIFGGWTANPSNQTISSKDNEIILDAKNNRIITSGRRSENKTKSYMADYGSLLFGLKAMDYFAVLDGANNRLLEIEGGTGSEIGFYNSFSDGSGGTRTDKIVLSGNLKVYGTKNRVIKTDNYDEKLQYCYEMAVPMFGDVGEAFIDKTGICYVYIDEIFSETVSTQIEYQVFLQKEGQGDLWVDSKKTNYFIVKGTPELKFAWEIKAKQKGYELVRMEDSVELSDEIEEIKYISEGQALFNQYCIEKEIAE